MGRNVYGCGSGSAGHVIGMRREASTGRVGGAIRMVLGFVAVAIVVAFPTRGSAEPPGLVAAYAFGEGSGTATADASGGGNAGSLLNAAWTTSGKYGNALVFNGTNARIDVPDAAALHLSSALTLEAWVKPAVVSNAWRDVIYKGNDNYYLEATSTGGSVPVGGGTIGGKTAEAKAGGALAPGTWSHLAVTYDGAGVRLYVNGTLAATTSKTGAIATSTNPLQIGGDTSYGQYFNGTIDEVRIYNVALTAAQIQADMTTPIGAGSSDTQPPSAPGTLSASAASSSQIDLTWGAAADNVGVTGYRIERCQGAGCTSFTQVATSTGTAYSDTGLAAGTSYSYQVRAVDAAGNAGPYSNVGSATTQAPPVSGLVAAYGFEEGSGTTVTDAAGNGNNGSIANATWTASGKYGNALVFNGSSARVNIPDSSSLHLSAGMTLEAWVNPGSVTSAWRDVIYKGNDNYYLEGTSSSGGVPAGGGTFGGASGIAYGASALPVNGWSYLALTYDGATLRLYVNGTQVGSQARSGSIATSTNQLQIGGDSIYSQYFNGIIDEVRIYSGPRSVSQIQTDMTTAVGGGGGSGDTQPPSAPGTLTATAASSSQINLSWGAATDNVGVTGYRIDRCQGAGCTNFSHLVQLTGTATTYSDTGLSASTTYSYQVRALDAAGNLGPVSNTATAVTKAGVAPSLAAAYGFEEGSGSTTADASGVGNTGTLLNATWTTSGKYGDALVFNGANARVNVPDSASLHLSTGMTLEAWVNPASSTSAWRDVIYKGNDNYYLEASSTAGGVPVGGGTFGGGAAEAKAASALTTGTWTYLAVTYDGANVRLYVNGTLTATTPKTGAIATSTNQLQIGGDSIYGQYFNGLIDEVRVYNAALGPAQIQTDMATPIGVPSAPSNLTASPASMAQIDLAWGASTDSAGVTGYRIERCQGAGCTNFAQIGSSSETTYSDTAVAANASYSYRVRAVDAAGNVGPYSNVATAFTGLQVTPRAVALTPGQAQQYTAALPGGGTPTVTWSVDGVVGGSASAGTITGAGLYTAGTAVAKHTVTATTQDQSQSASADAYVTNFAGMFTYHNDNMRTGQNLGETVLKPGNVNTASFGKLFSYPLDGIAYASPLYVANVSVPGRGSHNVVYVATEHDSVYAYDADGGSATPLWKRSFIDPANGITTVPATDTGECCDIAPEIGITSTPVIDPSTNTLYVVAKTKQVSGTTTYVQKLHALDLSTGAEKFGGPVVIQATVPGTGAGSTNGQVPFNSLRENQRTGLLLSNGVVYFGFASHGDNQPYHGWILGYDASSLQQRLAYCVTRNGEGAGVWMSGGGIATDSTGSLYFITGDGTFDANAGGSDFGDSYLKLTATGTVADYFTPYNQSSLDAANHDLGSGAALLLPDQPGAHPHLMLSAGKDGTIYVVDRDNMGHFNATSNSQIVQSLPNVFPNGTPEPGNFTAPVYYNGYVFFGPLGDNLQAFKLTNGLLSTSATFRSATMFGDRGASMAISANGPAADGVLWAVQRNGPTAPGVLYAYDPAGSGNGQLKELYDSAQAGSRDSLGDAAAKFNPPLIANGKVFVASVSKLTAYGLLP